MYKIFAVMICIGSFTCLYAKGSADAIPAKEFFDIAESYEELKKYDKAIEYYALVAKTKEFKNAAEYSIARVYGLQKNWSASAAILKKQHKAAPENIQIATAYAYALAASGQNKQALAMYKSLYDSDTENPEKAMNYVRMLIGTKNYTEAEDLLKTLTKEFEGSEEIKTLHELSEKLEALKNPPKEKKEDSKDKKQDEQKPDSDIKQKTEKTSSESNPHDAQKSGKQDKEKQNAAVNKKQDKNAPAIESNQKQEDKKPALDADKKKE
ncbi:tetratricopeptide repeat protein [Treponema phagedenis]|uniref:tetratricopeptide repeat protein n=1 Tax=Treponema phagedenis TaxID=162 RepID=UPI0001F64032|nr:tetratricopeptide repeat protein [Treponema phagedenis]EFW39471.1 hypothetical protein HMPREF9554_00004 [Treponema phagedenis F0421]TYT79264.1 tetratricopeptide repeat protein [Treponema phagedenis]